VGDDDAAEALVDEPGADAAGEGEHGRGSGIPARFGRRRLDGRHGRRVQRCYFHIV
jgi:hypothetical protein